MANGTENAVTMPDILGNSLQSFSLWVIVRAAWPAEAKKRPYCSLFTSDAFIQYDVSLTINELFAFRARLCYFPLGRAA